VSSKALAHLLGSTVPSSSRPWHLHRVYSTVWLLCLVPKYCVPIFPQVYSGLEALPDAAAAGLPCDGCPSDHLPVAATFTVGVLGIIVNMLHAQRHTPES